MKFSVALTAILLVTFQQSIASSSPVWAGDPQTASNVIWPTKSWEISTPEQQGMDSASLARLIETVGNYGQDSLTVVRHGKIVADAYYAPYLPGISHDLRSVTKSIVSTLTAIELQRGLLDSVDHPVVDFFPEKTILHLDENKKAMTVQTLLDMTSGIEWREKNYTPDETIMKMYRAPDRTEFVLSQPMSSNAPGSQFYYNSGNPYVLSALITKLSKENAFEFAKKELFGPLGIASAKWGKVDAQGVTDGEAGLSLSPHDMAKIGYLYLHNGVWEGKQIIPSSWVERAKEGIVPATFGLHYANLWWSLPEKGAYMALGRHSQMIIVLPKIDVVAVLTGALRDDQRYPLARLIDDISNSVKSDEALPTNSVSNSLLAASIKRAATERPSPLGGISEVAQTISGKTFQLNPNEMKVKTFSLNFFDTNSSWVITTDTGKSERPTEQFSGLMGLDGVYRKSPPALYGNQRR